jgi:hypothetical protein
LRALVRPKDQIFGAASFWVVFEPLAAGARLFVFDAGFRGAFPPADGLLRSAMPFCTVRWTLGLMFEIWNVVTKSWKVVAGLIVDDEVRGFDR